MISYNEAHVLLTQPHRIKPMQDQAVIHCDESYADELFDIASTQKFNYFFEDNEAHIIVDDVPYDPSIPVDPDVQLCDYYGIDYDKVNCIEAYDVDPEPDWVPEDLKELSKTSWGNDHIQFITA